MHKPDHLGEKLFQMRDYTPIPLIILMLFIAKPSPWTACLGTLLIIGGELLRIYSVAFIGSISRTRKDYLGNQLVSTGPFAWVRNPLYVANFLIVAGVAVFSGVLWFFILAVVLTAVQYVLIVSYEEELLLKRFGPEYEAYLRRVPAWFPRRLPGLDELELPPSLGLAIRSEQRTLSAIGLVLVLLMVCGA